MVLSSVRGSCGGNGIPGSKLYVFEKRENISQLSTWHLLPDCLGSNPSAAA